MIRNSWPKGRRGAIPTVVGAIVGALVAVGTHGAASTIHKEISGFAVVCIVIGVVVLAFVIQRLRRGGADRSGRDGSGG
jgi:uncharacterized membrane protein YeaQ/YmgE (transglycosylase-associated protein family)